MQIRPQQGEDRAAIRAVNKSAFETSVEADLFDALREQARPVIVLVVEDGGEVVGHIMLSRVMLPGHPELEIMGLVPMAVAPDRQRKGIGTALVRAGLEQCKALGFGAVVVLGHPEYYPRFGFSAAARFGIGSEYEALQEAFMLVELESGYMRGASGTVKCHAAFGGV